MKMGTIVKLFSNQAGEILSFLKKYNSSDISSVTEQTLEWEKIYKNPIEMADIIGIFIENDENFQITMWISLDQDALIHVTSSNADEIIRYLYERFPY